jgi:hypothetical protein
MSDLVEYEFVRRSSCSGQLHTLRIAMSPEQYAELQSPDRRHIQELLPQCTDAEREFLMTGITPEEWDALANHDEEEPELLTLRSLQEIQEAEQKLFDQVWYDRKQLWFQKIEHGEEICSPEILQKAKQAARTVEAKYSKADLGPWDDFQWGMICGKLSTLRWVTGDEWDMLDT